MTIKSIFEQFIDQPDFRESQRDMGITPAQHLKFLLAQAREDKHFALDSRVQHRVRFGHYAKSTKPREGVPEPVDRQGFAGPGKRHRQIRDGRKQLGADRAIYRGGHS